MFKVEKKLELRAEECSVALHQYTFYFDVFIKATLIFKLLVRLSGVGLWAPTLSDSQANAVALSQHDTPRAVVIHGQPFLGSCMV